MPRTAAARKSNPAAVVTLKPDAGPKADPAAFTSVFAPPSDQKPLAGTADAKLLYAYKEWLDGEQRLLNVEMFPKDWSRAEGCIFRTRIGRYHWADYPRGAKPSTRAAAVLDAVGAKWRDLKSRDLPPLEKDGRFFVQHEDPDPVFAAIAASEAARVQFSTSLKNDLDAAERAFLDARDAGSDTALFEEAVQLAKVEEDRLSTIDMACIENVFSTTPTTSEGLLALLDYVEKFAGHFMLEEWQYLPLIASVRAVVAGGESNVDAALIDLCERYVIKEAEYQELAGRGRRLSDEFNATKPPCPSAAFPTRADYFDIQLDMKDDSLGFPSIKRDGNMAYSAPQIEKLRAYPCISWQGVIDASQGPKPKPKAQARADAIVAAHDGWVAACNDIRSRLGIDELDQKMERLVDLLNAWRATINNIPARTRDGILAKGRAAASFHQVSEDSLNDDDGLNNSLLLDIARLGKVGREATRYVSANSLEAPLFGVDLPSEGEWVDQAIADLGTLRSAEKLCSISEQELLSSMEVLNSVGDAGASFHDRLERAEARFNAFASAIRAARSRALVASIVQDERKKPASEVEVAADRAAA